MFDSFEYENVNYKLFDQGVVEEDDDEYTDIRKNLNNSFRFNSNNADFTHLNQFVDVRKQLFLKIDFKRINLY